MHIARLPPPAPNPETAVYQASADLEKAIALMRKLRTAMPGKLPLAAAEACLSRFDDLAMTLADMMDAAAEALLVEIARIETDVEA